MRHQHIWQGALLVIAVVPMAGLMYWANAGQTRSAADLEFADRCVDRVHRNRGAVEDNDPAAANRCDLYFRTRSDGDADDDDKRWEARSAAARARTIGSAPADAR